VEDCEHFQGFLVFRSLGGAAGAGLASDVLRRIQVEFPKKTVIDFPLGLASRFSSSILEPYNVLLGLHEIIELADATFMMDNDALAETCRARAAIRHPSLPDLNFLVSQIVSSVTAPSRFPGPLNRNIHELLTNLIPYPRVQFPLVSSSPFAPAKGFDRDADPSVAEITEECFRPEGLLISCDLSQGNFLSSSLMYRGEVQLRTVFSSLYNIVAEREEGKERVEKEGEESQRKIKFIDWAPKGYNLSVNEKTPYVASNDKFASVSRSLTMLANHSAFRTVLERLSSKAALMYKKRSYLTAFHDGPFEMGMFGEAFEDLAALQKDYDQISTETVGDEEDEDYDF